ncbi:MAG TPA: biotin/lipoyl-containing protein [Anaerolineae bacterium]|nr:biotin/lipoyl-containing protein [Anaerolineae bacterium]
MDLNYQVRNEIKTVSIERVGERFQVRIGQATYTVTARQGEPGVLDLEVDGRQWRAYVAYDGPRHYVAIAGDTWVLERSQPGRQRSQAAGAAPDTGSLEATMPGLVREVLAQEGAEVKRGDTLVVLEAMKMELRVTAPHAGRVRRVHCVAGQVVERGQVLIEVEEGIS